MSVKNNIKYGEYATFINNNNEIIGGAIYWNQDEKNNKIYWTSDFWLFEDIRNVRVEFYTVKENILEVINVVKVAKLDISHNLILGKEIKGNIRIICD